ncbi:MAG TPA: hypothetical protein VNR60_09595 [Croceibacterium sp.]|nr:hypothetical protein [Croceibacterium sp.]
MRGWNAAGWIIGGWFFALLASALPVLWVLAGRVGRNHLGQFIDPATGRWTAQVYWQFFQWWLPIAVPVSLLALACMFLNRPR